MSGVLKEADGHSVDDLAGRRDAMLSALLAVRAQHDPSGPTGTAATADAKEGT